MNHRHFLAVAALSGAMAAGVLPGSAAPASAQDFPTRPITMIVAWPAGGGHDTVGRLMAEYMGRHLPQPIVVNNQPGAAGANGVRQASQSSADGYTIGVMGLHVIAQSYMNENAAPLSSLDPLALVEVSPATISVRTDTGIADLAGLVETLQADPNAIINANDGPGGFANISALLIQQALGVEFATIPYQGYAPAVAAIISGEANAATVPTAQMLPSARGGEVTILAVAGNERHFGAPDTPTFTEEGFPFVFHDFVGLFLPVGVPEERRALLSDAAEKAMSDPDFIAAAQSAGLVLAAELGEAFATFITEQDDAVYPVLEASGLVNVPR